MILGIFRRYYRSGVWAAGVLKVTPAAISQWLHGTAKNARLDIEMPKLADLLLTTEGGCIGANGPTVRSRIGHLRRKRRSK